MQFNKTILYMNIGLEGNSGVKKEGNEGRTRLENVLVLCFAHKQHTVLQLCEI